MIHSDDIMTLIDAVLVGSASDAERAQLAERITTEQEVAEQYVRAAHLHAQLRHVLLPGDVAMRPPMAVTQDDARSVHANRIGKWRLVAAVSAIAAVLALMVGSLFFQPDAPAPTTEQTKPHVAQPVAILTNMEKAVFARDGAPMDLGEALSAGSIELVSGTVQVMFNSTAVVDLIGPCEFKMIGENKGRLVNGKLVAFVPPRASGFVIETPNGVRVEDLGTRFTVRVEAGQTHVFVREGKIAVHPPGGSAYPMIAGQRALFDRSGNQVPTSMAMDVPVKENLFIHYDAGRGVDVDADGWVRRWRQQAGNPDVGELRAEGLSQPRWISEVPSLGGQPAVRFDGQNARMICDSLVSSDSIVRGPWTVIWVGRFGQKDKQILIDGIKEDARSLVVRFDGAMVHAGPDRDAHPQFKVDVRQSLIGACVFGDEDHPARMLTESGPVPQNNQSTRAPDPGMSGLVVGGRGPAPGVNLQGDLAELLIYRRCLDDAELREVIDHLWDKYQLDLKP